MALLVSRRAFVLLAFSAAVLAGRGTVAQAVDPLPSWNEGRSKRAITDFVARVTAPGADFVPVAERIATFDNDGTLCAEAPIYFQLAFALDRVKALSPQHPEWVTIAPFKEVLAGDINGMMAGGEKAVLEILAVTHAGMTTDEFTKIAADWVTTARHPRFNRPYVELTYAPMRELLSFLRANGFKTFIVSGGGIEFMRAWTEKAYGMPLEQVVGSSGVTEFHLGQDGSPVLLKLPKIEFVDDGPGKPAGINRFIGRRPIFAFGNSDGDQQMLEWTTAGAGGRFAGLVHHTDGDREYAYDRDSSIGKLDKALDQGAARGWTIVDMRSDWGRIFA